MTTMKAVSGRDDLERALRLIDGSLARDVTAYLIGGCAMMLYNAKMATKDVDLALMSAQDAWCVVDALSKNGFKRTEPENDAYCRLGTTIIMEDDKGMRIDIFVETVCRKLRVSKAMVARSTIHARYGRLEIRLISPEDIFLFKSMTERAGDLDDMALLSERGLDWSVVLDECSNQSGEVILESFVAVRLQELEEEKGIVVPIKADLEAITEKKLSSRHGS
jgi:hypothetical protein